MVETRTAGLPRLVLRGTDLTIVPGSLRVAEDAYLARYERLIDTWAGRTKMILLDGADAIEVKLDIAPPKSKLMGGEWEALITELAAVSESLPWGMSPGDAPGTQKPDALATVHPAIIEHEIPILCRLMKVLLNDPPTRTVRIRAQRPLVMSRAADLGTLRWLSRRPLELAGLRGEVWDEHRPNPRVLADQPAVAATLDHPVTRYVCYLLARVEQRLVDTTRRLRQSAKHGVPDPAERAYANQLAGDVEVAKGLVETMRQAPLFRAVSPEPLSDAVLQSLQDHPLQSAIHRACRALLRPGLAYGPGQDLLSGLKHSYDLFELLVLYRLVAMIGMELGTAWSSVQVAKVGRLPHEDRPRDGSSWLWQGPDGSSIELRYQALFRSAGPFPDKRHFVSLSARGVPDFVIVRRKGNDAPRWMILDAKYRASRQSVHDGLADVHRYRDALRLQGTIADAAFIIVPRLGAGAHLYGTLSYIEAYRLGALAIYEGDWTAPLRKWLAKEAGRISGPPPVFAPFTA